MTTAKVLNEVPISMANLKEDLESIKEREKELNFRANKTLEYLNSITTQKKSKDIIKKLNELQIPRLKEQHIAKIADVIPRNIEELKVILTGYTITVNPSNLKKIVEAVNEFFKKE